MNKRTHKLRQLSDVAGTIAAAGSISAAARALGVNRSSLHRWLRAGKVSRPQGRRRPSAGITTPRLPSRTHTPAAWARSIRQRFTLTVTEARLLDLALAALTIGLDVTARPDTRLAAMGRFQSLTKQLALEEDMDGEATPPHTADVRQWPRRVG